MAQTSAVPALAGIRVVSLALNLPGPLAASRLATLGASVTKIEPPTGDPLRVAAPGWYAELVAGQEVVTMDLGDSASREALEERLAAVDVLLTAMRPSALGRLGLAQSVQRHGLVHVEIVGYDGDREDEGGHDLTYQAVQGTLAPPAMPLVPVVDLLGAERAVTAALAGLRRRAYRAGAVRERAVLDEAAFEASAALRHGLTGPGGVLGGALPGYGIYATADGHVAVGAIEPHFAQRLGDEVGRTSAELAARFVTQPSAYWESLGRSRDIPIAAVQDGAAVGEPGQAQT